MVDVIGVTKTFGDKIALDQVSLKVEKQTIFGLIGPDGAGKTTLFRTICGLLPADRGQVLLQGTGLDQLAPGQLGYMPQRFSLYRDLSIMENLYFWGSLYGLTRDLILERAENILDVTGLSPFKTRLADQLSGGMKQKLALSCALLTRPSILILDEPTYGVDPNSRKEFWKILYQLNHEGMTILLSTPYMDEAELCHQLAFINQGRIVAADTPEHLKARLAHQVLEVRSEIKDPYFFDRLPGVLFSSFFGYKYRLIVTDIGTTSKNIEQHLKSSSGGKVLLEEADPSMEDLFVFLTETAGGQGAQL
jgi:ABC-2 type transport system ATP-binding protein